MHTRCHGKVKDIYKSKELWRGPESIYRKERVLALSSDTRSTLLSFSASCHMYLVSIYDRSIIKASIVNHPFKEIKSVLHSRITSSSNALRRGQSSLVSYDSNEERPSPDIN
jgi:hypothetical protein